MSEKGLVVEFSLPSRKKAEEPAPAPVSDPVSRLARLLALAHKWEGMVRRGEVSGYAEIARRMGLSRARVTQIASLATLALDLQERLLLQSIHLPERRLRHTAAQPMWHQQRNSWPNDVS